jgi:hypothetical protein
MDDLWLPRIHMGSQVVLLVVCAILILCGHNSTITDLFCAGAGGILATTTYTAITKGKTPADTTK